MLPRQQTTQHTDQAGTYIENLARVKANKLFDRFRISTNNDLLIDNLLIKMIFLSVYHRKRMDMTGNHQPAVIEPF